MQELAPFPVVTTERLLLREIGLGDVERLFEIHGDPDLMKWFGSDPISDIAAAEGLVKLFASWRVQANPGTRWGLQTQQDQQLLGTCGLFGWNRSWRKCLVGYELAPQAQGNGYMLEALSAALSWGFTNMALNRIEAQIHPDNSRSVRLARQLGFVEEGCLRQVAYWRGQHHDMLQFSLLRSEWNTLNAAASLVATSK